MFSGQKFVIKGGDQNGPRKRVAVIGCGAAGLVSLKTGLEYGHDVIGYERLSDIGGIWNFKNIGSRDSYTDLPAKDVPSYPMHSLLKTNTSQYLTMFSDFIPLQECKQDFLGHQELCSYLKAYADHFNLLPRIRFQRHVSKLEKQDSKWHITSSGSDSDEEIDVFDFVLVCTGAGANPRKPTIKGMDKFKGLQIHSCQIRNGSGLFKDKNVLIIGGAVSAGEMIELGLANDVKKLYVSPTSRPDSKSVWYFERHVKSIYGDKLAYDHLINRENAVVNWPDSGMMFSQFFYPAHKCTPDARLTVPNDILGFTNVRALKENIKSKVLQFVAPVERFDEDQIYLSNGEKLSPVDTVIFATGYEARFPFLDHIWSRNEQVKFELYNYTIPLTCELDGIGFILLTPTAAPELPFAELQSRWFTHQIISRDYNSNGEIFDEEERNHIKESVSEKRSQIPPYVTFNFIDNMNLLNDFMAEDIGAKPPDYRALIATGDESQIELGVALAYGPIFPMQYRIQGPYPWPRASKECIALTKRILGKHFYDYVSKVKVNEYPKSGQLDPIKGPYNDY